jgi:hypothetical protein
VYRILKFHLYTVFNYFNNLQTFCYAREKAWCFADDSAVYPEVPSDTVLTNFVVMLENKPAALLVHPELPSDTVLNYRTGTGTPLTVFLC